MLRNRSLLAHSKPGSSLIDSKPRSPTPRKVGFQTVLRTRNGHQVVAKISSLHQPIPLAQAPTEILQKLSDPTGYINTKQPLVQSAIEKVNQAGSMKKQVSSVLAKPKNVIQNTTENSRPYVQQTPMKAQNDNKSNAYILSLDELLKKVEALLQMKIAAKCKTNSLANFDLQADDLEADLQNLVAEISSFSATKQVGNSHFQAQINQINQKIGIFEKIIAQSFTESQILKKYYFAKKFSKKAVKNFSTQLARSWVVQPEKNKQNYQQPSVTLSSTSQWDYLRPSNDAYERQSKNNKIYLPNRQNLGMSSYQTEYLNYGSLPTYAPKQPEISSSGLGFVGLKQKSLYQTDFNHKIIKLEDTKLLDCRQDKIRPTNISFMPRKMANCKENDLHLCKSLTRKAEGVINYKDSNMSSSVTLFNSYHRQQGPLTKQDWHNRFGMRTEYGDTFTGAPSTIESLPKSSSLTSLKYQYRKNANL